MDGSPTLREVFDRLAAGEPATVPADLDAALLGHALRDYSDTSRIEVAEHLEQFLTAREDSLDADPGLGMDLLSTAPPVWEAPVSEAAGSDAPVPESTPADDEPAPDLDFGTGTIELDTVAWQDLRDVDDVADDARDELAEDPTEAETFGTEAPGIMDSWWPEETGLDGADGAEGPEADGTDGPGPDTPGF